ncbi:polymeric immunoglobulin receptor-like [Clarias gariepinus]|uniref:polymeric immunoglobulin receptor-like n=1 Tax=Clarias gariepinus TaxID=13013 RepID=UPI00234D8EE3|nr:polymeric immunoglobulin receptor-like [Clarias gariepinus]
MSDSNVKQECSRNAEAEVNTGKSVSAASKPNRVASQAYRHFHVKTGTSVTIPCGYNRDYIKYKKYWCYGKYFHNCQIQNKVTVTDHKAERFFTVTMNNLQTGNTGWYWCAVEIGGGPDTGEYLYITVKSGPDLSVKQSNVAGWERGNLTVQCLYSTAYRNEQKKWCRFKDGSCTTATLKSPVKVIDDQKTTFSLQMSELKKSDAGWYCCIAGDLQASFNVSVGDPPDPDLSVKESRVRGEEGGNVTVQCLYSTAYQNEQKQWCRFKDKNCNTFQRTETSQNSAVQLSDDGRGSFSVEMRGLKKSDAGWYWCGAGDLQVPVHVSVSDPPPESQNNSVLQTTEGCDSGSTEDLRS